MTSKSVAKLMSAKSGTLNSNFSYSALPIRANKGIEVKMLREQREAALNDKKSSFIADFVHTYSKQLDERPISISLQKMKPSES